MGVLGRLAGAASGLVAGQSKSGAPPGRLAGAASGLVADQSKSGAPPGRANTRPPGTVPIAQVADREYCQVSGLIRSVVVGAPGQGHGFEIDLHDGSGSLAAVWLSQREIPELRVGRRVTVEGRATVGRDGRCRVLNPRYRLMPLGKTA